MPDERERLHEHPDFSYPPKRAEGKHTHILGYRLNEGDVLEEGDMYSSSNGFWEPCPCPGNPLGPGLYPAWVRPSK